MNLFSNMLLHSKNYLIQQIGTNIAMFTDHFYTLVMVTVSFYNQQ